MKESGTTLLERTFVTFHTVLDRDVKRALSTSSLAAITFSDSAFVIFEHSEIAFTFAQCLMRHLLFLRVPVRMGLAFGSYNGLRFSADSGSTITLHAAQFLGSAIVRAYRTEACGHPGMRILLHPDLPIPRDYRRSTLPVTDPPPPGKKLRMEVVSELNYLDPVDPDIPTPVLPPPSLFPGVSGWVEALRPTVGQMRNASPQEQRYHYDYTLRAIDRMRATKGFGGLSDQSIDRS
jgi:hypothetical protein